MYVFADIQKAFDADVASGAISVDGWCQNATEDGVLGYKLLTQTGDLHRPVDKTRVSLSGSCISDQGKSVWILYIRPG